MREGWANLWRVGEGQHWEVSVETLPLDLQTSEKAPYPQELTTLPVFLKTQKSFLEHCM